MFLFFLFQNILDEFFDILSLISPRIDMSNKPKPPHGLGI